MKQSNSKLLKLFFSIAFMLGGILFFTFFISSPDKLFFKDNYVPSDVWDYAAQINQGLISDWFSPLFLIENIGIKKICEGILGFPIDALDMIAWVNIALLSISSFVLCIWCSRYSQHYASLIIISIILSLGICWSCKLGRVGLDSAFVTPFILSIEFIFQTVKANKKSTRFLYAILLVIMLIHTVSFRKNFILLVPYYFWIISAVLIKPISLKNRFFVTSFGTLFLYLAANTLVNTSVQAIKTYPLIPMCASEIGIAKQLNGNTQDDTYRLVSSPVFETKLQATANFENLNWAKVGIEHTADKKIRVREGCSEIWETLKKLYIQEWINHPCEMMEAKLLEVSDFYLMGKRPDILVNFISDRHPNVNIDILKDSQKASSFLSYIPGSERSWGVAFMLLLLIYIRKFGQKTWQKAELDFLSHIIILPTLYILTFMIITPTIDYRYTTYMNVFYLFACLIVFFAILKNATTSFSAIKTK